MLIHLLTVIQLIHLLTVTFDCDVFVVQCDHK